MPFMVIERFKDRDPIRSTDAFEMQASSSRTG